MYLSRLELHGFKSFADRTVVDFSPGVTVVVGPNGCGKSNIVDAVRWVIGEQRARILRSDKMDSVIFNGTSKRRSLGMAEVLLTIENTRGVLPTEYREVTIGRRLYRSGESEYILNGVQCRLKDITDLFMDTGMGAGAYSVIELKMIEEILSENADERRHLFEEAAGITKYKIRRSQTLRKLKGTQVDLDRVRDIIEELASRVRSLERQAQKATRFKRYDEQLQALELTLAGVEYVQLSSEAAAVKKEILNFSDTGAGLSAKLSAEEANYEAFRKDHISREKLVVEAQIKLADHVEALRSTESDLRLGTERLSTISRDLSRIDSETEADVGQRESLTNFLKRTEQEMAEVQPAAEMAENALTDAKRIRDETQSSQQKHQVMLHNLRLEERQALNSRTEHQRQIDRLSSRIDITTADMVEARTSLDLLGSTNTSTEERHNTSEKELQRASAAKMKAREALTEAEKKGTGLNIDLERARLELRSAERAHDAACAEGTLLEGLLSSWDDFSQPIQFLATSKDWSTESMLTVADVISCEEGLREAVDTALGVFASCIVVKTQAEAHRAIQSLRANNKGRATFLVMENLTPSPAKKTGSTHECLSSLVRVCDPVYEPLIDLLFGQCYLVGSLENLPVKIPGRVYTRAGEWTDPAGYVHAGSDSTATSIASGRLGRREQLDSVRLQIEETTTDLTRLEAAARRIAEKLSALPLSALKEAFDVTNDRFIECEKALARVVYEREVVVMRKNEMDERIQLLSAKKAEAESNLGQANEDLKGITLSLVKLQGKRADGETAFADIEAASRKAFSLFNEANITAVQTLNRLDNLKRDSKRNADDIEQLDRRQVERGEAVKQFNDQKIMLEKRCADQQVSIRGMQDSRGELDLAVSATKSSLMETRVSISEMETRIRELRRDRESAMKEESSRAVRQAELETRLEDLVLSFAEDYEIDLTTYEFDIPEDFERSGAKSEVQILRNRIRSLGPVNALALESFEEEKERLEFLRTQLADLERAEETLMTTIDEINTAARERFDKTFGAIRENFQRLFVELFGAEASADILLNDDSDPLESDVNIIAKPSGKKPSVLAQLSGGEKTLTAIALLFAIYLVKPSPFCILDEVDAPLDDANVDRFMHLIRSFSESTQFVLVTHNKRTMEAADRMYGITMQEQGVSKLVGVKFEDEKAQQVA